MKYVSAFGRFWWDFIVGDSVVLAIGGAAVLILGALLVAAGADELVQIVLPLAVAVTLALSLRPSR
ncbi:MAG: hypothetical protein ACJ789_03830 [Thermomicrobiales bacterium]